MSLQRKIKKKMISLNKFKSISKKTNRKRVVKKKIKRARLNMMRDLYSYLKENGKSDK